MLRIGVVLTQRRTEYRIFSSPVQKRLRSAKGLKSSVYRSCPSQLKSKHVTDKQEDDCFITSSSSSFCDCLAVVGILVFSHLKRTKHATLPGKYSLHTFYITTKPFKIACCTDKLEAEVVQLMGNRCWRLVEENSMPYSLLFKGSLTQWAS
jgi:hypothetical protein